MILEYSCEMLCFIKGVGTEGMVLERYHFPSANHYFEKNIFWAIQVVEA